jgi:hypothetical protein
MRHMRFGHKLVYVVVVAVVYAVDVPTPPCPLTITHPTLSEPSNTSHWDDVDLEGGSLQVRRTLAITKSGPVFTSPKTTSSRRSVKLSSKGRPSMTTWSAS